MDESDLLRAEPPAFLPAEALRLVRDSYGLVATDLRPLDSERDQMFFVTDDAGALAVLKISNLAESPETLDMECRAMAHLTDVDPMLPIPGPILTIGGEPVGSATHEDGTRHLVRLMTVLTGTPAEGRPVSLELAANVGDVCARVSVGLQGFFHAGAGRPIGWDIRVERAADPALAGSASSGAARRPSQGGDPADPLGARLADARRRIRPALAATRALPSGVQHADVTLTNVLRHDDSDDVSGVIDFGDMHHTAAACDLAASLTSVLRSTGPAVESPWELAAAFLDGYQRRRPLLPAEAEVLGHLVLARIVTTLDISRARADRHHRNRAYITQYDEGRRLLLEMLTDLTDDELAARFARLAGAAPRRSSGADLAARRAAVLGGRLAPTFYDEPLRIDRGDGPWLFDADGNRYLDAYNNVAVAGHNHPAITAAVVRQLRTLNTNSRYLHPEMVALAERLTASMPDGLDTCVFTTSGTEAVELAWRMAAAYTGSAGTLVTEWAYHGISGRTHDFSPNDWRHEHSVADVATFPAPHAGGEPLDRDHARRRVLTAAGHLRAHGVGPAVLMVDPQFTSEGILEAPADFMAGLVAGIHEVGGLFLADEVQSGFGRSGPRLWRFAIQSITPDLVTLGKPMGAGLPVAAVVTRREIADAFARDHEYFSTFAGNPVVSAAASAVLDVLEDRRIPERAVRVGQHLRAGVTDLARRFRVISAVRGYGLIAGIDLRRSERGGGPAFAASVVEGLRRRRVLAGRTGRRGDVLKVRPPLVWREEHADRFIAALEAVLSDLDRPMRARG